MIPPIFSGMHSRFMTHIRFVFLYVMSTFIMLHRYDLHKCTFLYNNFYLHIMFTLETLPKSDNCCLVRFIFRNVLTFEVTIDILRLVKRYSFNPLYNPYILIIYTPLNERRSLGGRFSFRNSFFLFSIINQTECEKYVFANFSHSLFL